ncbi:YggT family protein [Phenylobacterium parvum]|jgi:YggT family protein|uniref:YggT family protein n=1 Tax=Phenylobacterium parvum TaxID=2201350 RepID=A0A2Z3HRP2_9CAUL|nr:YggT family protein [Phenylobacterium parvum]AWM78507.1 YggT family protein [Phenylobacterium parvum]
MIGSFLHFVLNGLIDVMIWAIIISAIMSWLTAFNVVNLRNGFVAGVHRVLETLTAPVLGPLQRIIPPLGGLDITPIIAILVLQGIQRFILPGLLGGL